jgi:hypothetical protein
MLHERPPHDAGERVDRTALAKHHLRSSSSRVCMVKVSLLTPGTEISNNHSSAKVNMNKYDLHHQMRLNVWRLSLATTELDRPLPPVRR